ncbi:hypothetical protein [Helicobacter sp. T3_23-1056]
MSLYFFIGIVNIGIVKSCEFLQNFALQSDYHTKMAFKPEVSQGVYLSLKNKRESRLLLKRLDSRNLFCLYYRVDCHESATFNKVANSRNDKNNVF